MATTVFHKLKHKNEWLYVTTRHSPIKILYLSLARKINKSKNHILAGADIITLKENCRGYANREILIPGRIAGRMQYTDFIPKTVMKELDSNNESSHFTKTMKFHHAKTNQMSDLNDITVKHE